MDDLKKRLGGLGKFKYPLLILLLGILLMLLPSASGKENEAAAEDLLIAQLLQSSEGVGEARAAISESGVVIVCRGAQDPRVRLDIIRAVKAYTGFSADKITILKMAH